MTPHRIAILCYPTMGGSGVLATQLGISLAERGHTVHVLSYAAPSRLRAFISNLRFHLVQVSTYPLFRYPSYDLALASKVIEIAGNDGLDIVHAHYAIPHSISAILAREVFNDHSLKVVTTLHGTDITLVGSERAYVPLIRHALNKSDAVTSVSQFLARETNLTFCSNCPVEIIPNFVDREAFQPSPWPRQDGSPLTIVHVSNFRPVKRTPDLIHIFKRVRQSIDAHLLLVGDGPDLAVVQELAGSMNLAEHVTFLGQQTDIPGILARADAFLLTSETESFGLSALESLACGIPAICYDVGGLHEIIETGRSGFLLPLGDVEAMAEACARVLDDAGLRQRMREYCLERARSFDKELIVDRYLDLYERTLRS